MLKECDFKYKTGKYNSFHMTVGIQNLEYTLLLSLDYLDKIILYMTQSNTNSGIIIALVQY
jgi:hypothetical protein